MPGATPITIVGTLGGDPDSRTVGGSTVANFSVAVTERKFNRDTNEFEDVGTSWYRCAAWRELGEHVAGSLSKGSRVIVQGTLRSREYEKDGATHTAWEVECEEVGPSLRFATASVQRVERGGQQRGGQPRQSATVRNGGYAPTQAPAQQQWPTQGGYDDETPF